MGMRVNLYSYDFNQLVSGIANFVKTDYREKIEKILLIGGNKIGDRYIILDNELYEYCNPCENIPSVIDRCFGVEDTFGECFYTFDNKFGRKTLISSTDFIEDILESLEEEE